MRKPSSPAAVGVRSHARRALGAAAVAGLAGLAIAPTALAAEADAPVATAPATADADVSEVSGVKVDARKPAPESPKYTAKPLDTPQTITVVSQGVIEAQNLLSLRDILSTVPGITFGAGEGGGGFGDSINLRGYSANNDLTIDGVRDSAQYSRSDPFNLEQLEVVNGANGVYSGSGSVGGTINMVTKRPGRRDSIGVSAGVGTEGYLRATVDANQRIGETIAVRLNAMAHKNDVPGRDVEKFERWGVAPSIVFGLEGPTQFTILYSHQEDTNTPQYGVPFYNGRALPGVDPSNYYGYSNVDTQEQTVDVLTGIIEHRFSDNFSIRNLARFQKVTQLTIVDPPQGTFCLANGTKAAAWSQTNLTGFTACLATDPAPGFYQPSGPRGNLRDSENTLLYNQTDATLSFTTGALKHRLVVGAAFLSEDFHLDTGNVLRTATGGAVTLPTMNIANPNTVYAGPRNYFRSSIQDGERRNQSSYAFDNVELSEQFAFNFGVRYEYNEGENRTDNYATTGVVTPGTVFGNDEHLVSYRFGLVYKPIPNASLYLAYGNAQTPSQATVNGAGACSVATCTVDPEEAENFELGGKWDLHGGRLSLTASVFRNDRSNYKVASGDPTVPDQQLDGSARVDGVALGASGRLTDKWSVFANYTYLDSKVLQGVSDYNAALGLDFTRGDPLTSVPDHAFSLFTTYDLPRDIQVGYGLTYQGEYYLTQHGQVTAVPPVRTSFPLVTAEDYWVHRATVSWRVNRSLDLRLNVNNLFDEVYYNRGRNNGWATPGERRSARLTLNYRF
ncbi:TonB-dependent receptor [Caulobacter hibisci]|uniref:TonB-dependent siderophore receptor n=1 Tax=Caulobacter hibisci TaxID=2035993 RepID=A0ABS0SUM4_9CAUL|nr:TonB-dependent siderophore receptor [Caulobacter hibisci]MBI1683345.1 TonB-dependent siderophore receptor [Caulobacter hibisci]